MRARARICPFLVEYVDGVHRIHALDKVEDVTMAVPPSLLQASRNSLAQSEGREQ